MVQRTLWACLGFVFAGLATQGADPDPVRSARAVDSLKAAIASRPKSIDEAVPKDLAAIPLTKSDSATARRLIWEEHVRRIRAERAEEVKNKKIVIDKLEMRYDYTVFGQKPKSGRSLWISLHGGGGAPPKVNDGQWENQKRLYKLEEGIYLAPRAPTNTWNLWHEGHIDRFFGRLIENMIVFEDVNPDRVFVLGYSAGGDGVYQIGPRMADSWAAAAMMAGHPNGASMLSLRNTPFALQVGAEDSRFDRNKVGAEYGEKLAALHKADPKGYEHFVRIRKGKEHWMDGEDKEALPWMAKYTRNPVPDKVVWHQSGTVHDRFYWLAVPKSSEVGGSLVIARRNGQEIVIDKAEKVTTLLIRCDDRFIDLEKPVVVQFQGKELYRGPVHRTLATLLASLGDRGDPRLIFDGQVSISFAPPK